MKTTIETINCQPMTVIWSKNWRSVNSPTVTGFDDMQTLDDGSIIISDCGVHVATAHALDSKTGERVEIAITE